MIDSKIRLDNMIQEFKERDYRITPQRIAILKILAESTAHPSIEQIYEQVKINFPTTSIATVYKTIVVLKEMGEVLEINFGDGSSRYDGNQPYPHPHLICITCKKIMHPELDTLNGVTEELVKDTGFKITSHRLDFFGICPECLEKDNDTLTTAGRRSAGRGHNSTHKKGGFEK
jgi:Fur family peroxide stress response transcriptional regulator